MKQIGKKSTPKKHVPKWLLSALTNQGKLADEKIILSGKAFARTAPRNAR